MTDTRETILALARTTAQARGYSGLSFRELGKAVGIKSASIHYHFPTKADLGAALARRYCDDAKAALDEIWAASPDAATRLRLYAGIFRLALANDNRMCMCGYMAAEHDDLPESVQIEVLNFADLNVAWIAQVLTAHDPDDASLATGRHARAIFAAIGGAQLAARSRGDIKVFDEIVESYRVTGFIPA